MLAIAPTARTEAIAVETRMFCYLRLKAGNSKNILVRIYNDDVKLRGFLSSFLEIKFCKKMNDSLTPSFAKGCPNLVLRNNDIKISKFEDKPIRRFQTYDLNLSP